MDPIPDRSGAITTDIPEEQVTYAAQDDTSQDQGVDPKKVRPNHIGEFVRKYLSEAEIEALVTAVGRWEWVCKGKQRLWQTSSSDSTQSLRGRATFCRYGEEKPSVY